MKLFITVDTEADDWDDFRPCSDGPCSNIRELPRAHELFARHAMRPSYLVSHRVATDREASATLRRLLEGGDCEIGAHCHPWETPPYIESNSLSNTMLCNLPPDLQRQKIQTLTECLTDAFGVRPISFRAGRWGYSYEVARSIRSCGYLIDTSVTPYITWEKDYGPDFSNLSLFSHSPDTKPVFPDSPSLDLIEVPATIGYLQRDFATAHARHQAISKSWMRHFRVGGMLYHLRLLNKVWLSPEIHEARDMIELVKRLQRQNFDYINMVFHSQTLCPGLSPFARTKEDSARFLKRLSSFLEFAAAEGIIGSTLREEFAAQDEDAIEAEPELACSVATVAAD